MSEATQIASMGITTMIELMQARDEIKRLKEQLSKQEQGEPVTHCEAGAKYCHQCRLEDRSLVLAAAVRYVKNNTPKLVSDEICNALNHIPDAKKMVKQEQGEPVAWRHKGEPWKFKTNYCIKLPDVVPESWEPLYTTPQQRKPLTDEQIFAIGKELGLKCRLGGNPNIDIDYARAIEAAHGIKE